MPDDRVDRTAEEVAEWAEVVKIENRLRRIVVLLDGVETEGILFDWRRNGTAYRVNLDDGTRIYAPVGSFVRWGD